MKIIQLDIQGFRSLKNVSWRPGDLNVVIGPNGSGKSNLLKMLELISTAAQGKLREGIDIWGGITQLLWDGQTNWIGFSLVTLRTDMGEVPERLIYEVGIKSLSGANEYRVESEVLRNIDDEFGLIVRGKATGKVYVRLENGMSEMATSTLATEETLLSATGSPFFAGVAKSGLPDYKTQTTSWSIYQDIRTDQNAPVRKAPVSRLEQRVLPSGQNLINVLHTLYTSDRKFKQDINDAMFAAFGDDFDELIFPPAADQRIQMRVRWKTLKREQSTADLSDGILRFLFLLTVLAGPNRPRLLPLMSRKRVCTRPCCRLSPSMRSKRRHELRSFSRPIRTNFSARFGRHGRP